jgi:hypothetical protein
MTDDKANASLGSNNGESKRIVMEEPSSICRAPEADSCVVTWLRDLPNQVKKTLLINHTVAQTTVYLESNAELLEQLTWDDLYKDVRLSTATVASKSHSDVSAFIAFPTFGIEALCCCAA